MNRLKKKVVSWVLLLIVTLGTIGQSIPLANAANVEMTKAKITNFVIEHGDASTGNTFNYWETFKLKISWDASMYENKVHAGDYFTVSLPDTMKFPQDTTAKNFDITDNQNNVVAHGKVTPLLNGGGNVRVTFTDYVENKYNIKGTMSLASEFNNMKVQHGTTNKFDIQLNGGVFSSSVLVGQIGVDPTEDFYKWSSRLDNPNEAAWTIRLNYNKGNTYSNLKISDSLFSPDGRLQGIHYVEGSFVLRKVKVLPNGGIEQIYETRDINKDIKFNADKTSFTYEFGTLNVNDQYIIEYKTTYVAGVQLKNKATFKSDEKTKETFAHYEDAYSSGTGQGDLLGKIVIVKVDEMNQNKRLSNAIFKVTKISDGSVNIFTTDANGEISIGKLLPGQYTIEEIKAPDGYVLNGTPRTVTVVSGVVNVQTFTNMPPVGKIQIIKQDKQTQEKLSGAEFDIRDENGNLKEHVMTDVMGVAQTKTLLQGKYTVTETKAPQGYILNSVSQTVFVSNGVMTLVFENEKCQPEKGRIKIQKQDAQCGAPLFGAEFVIIDASGREVSRLVTNYFGEASIELPVGVYQVKEVRAPQGYILNQTPQTVTVVKNKLTTVTFYNEKCQPNRGIIKIKKYDARCNYALAGAEFAITDESGKVVSRLVTNAFGEVAVELPVGTYQVREVKAPAGYQLEQKIVTATVMKDKTTTITFYNKKVNDCYYVQTWNNCYNYYYTACSTNCYYYMTFC